MSNKVLILASGGLDSSVLIALYSNLGYEVHILYFDYGNLNMKSERIKLSRVCSKHQVPLANIHYISLDLNWSSGGCLNSDNGNHYVEMRNLIFLSNAISFAQAREIPEIAVGFIDHPTPYPDTTQEFVNYMNDLALGTIGLIVKAPLINLDKYGVYKLGEKLGIKLKDTFSCNQPRNDKPCGECPDCKDIKNIIEKFGVADSDNPFL